MKLDAQELQAAANLIHNPDFKVVMGMVAKRAGTMNERLIKAPQGDEWLRGQVCAYSNFLEDINTATNRIAASKQPKT